MNISYGAGGFNTSIPTDAPVDKRKSRTTQNCVPLSIIHLTSCKDATFTYLGQNVQIIYLVAILRKFIPESTKARCTLDDGTGEISGTYWLEHENDEIRNIPPVKEGTPVGVYASPRLQDNERTIIILKMFPIDDCNLVLNHLIQVVHKNLKIKGTVERETSAMDIGNSSRPNDNILSFSEFSGTNWREAINKKSPLQAEILETLKRAGSSTSNVGISIDEILKHFPESKHKDVRETLRFLVEEGHVFSTIDPDHFKCTDD